MDPVSLKIKVKAWDHLSGQVKMSDMVTVPDKWTKMPLKSTIG